MTDYSAKLEAIEARLREIQERNERMGHPVWLAESPIDDREDTDYAALVGWVLEMVVESRRLLTSGDTAKMDSLARALGIEDA